MHSILPYASFHVGQLRLNISHNIFYRKQFVAKVVTLGKVIIILCTGEVVCNVYSVLAPCSSIIIRIMYTYLPLLLLCVLHYIFILVVYCVAIKCALLGLNDNYNMFKTLSAGARYHIGVKHSLYLPILSALNIYTC